jgi:alpha-L-arabinofuranosidase
VLTAPEIHAHNTFDQKQAVIPQERELQDKGSSLTFTFPAASVTTLQLALS